MSVLKRRTPEESARAVWWRSRRASMGLRRPRWVPPVGLGRERSSGRVCRGNGTPAATCRVGGAKDLRSSGEKVCPLIRSLTPSLNRPLTFCSRTKHFSRVLHSDSRTARCRRGEATARPTRREVGVRSGSLRFKRMRRTEPSSRPGQNLHRDRDPVGSCGPPANITCRLRCAAGQRLAVLSLLS